MTFDEVKCFGSPRTSQMPRSGSDHPVARALVHPDRVEDRAPDVVLLLVERPVPDAYGARVLVAVEVVEDLLVEVPLTVDAVHDLDLVPDAGHVGDEREEVVGLPVEPEPGHGPQRQGRVPDPRVAVVPVPFATNGFRQ